MLVDTYTKHYLEEVLSMLVYRVEDKNGFGPYLHSGAVTDAQCDLGMELLEVHDTSRHPAPMEDFNYKVLIGDKCAFTTLDALVGWFTKPENYLPELDEAGFSTCVYEVSEVIGGHTDTKQCVIPREADRILVEKLS